MPVPETWLQLSLFISPDYPTQEFLWFYLRDNLWQAFFFSKLFALSTAPLSLQVQSKWGFFPNLLMIKSVHSPSCLWYNLFQMLALMMSQNSVGGMSECDWATELKKIYILKMIDSFQIETKIQGSHALSETKQTEPAKFIVWIINCTGLFSCPENVSLIIQWGWSPGPRRSRSDLSHMVSRTVH